MKETKTYTGMLNLRDPGEAMDILYVSSIDRPLAEVLADEISGRTVSVRYWVTDKEVSKDAAAECFIGRLMGQADCEFMSWYSEVTGYLWTDENIKIGGHDLLAELQSYVGRYLILEVDLYD